MAETLAAYSNSKLIGMRVTYFMANLATLISVIGISKHFISHHKTKCYPLATHYFKIRFNHTIVTLLLNNNTIIELLLKDRKNGILKKHFVLFLSNSITHNYGQKGGRGGPV